MHKSSLLTEDLKKDFFFLSPRTIFSSACSFIYMWQLLMATYLFYSSETTSCYFTEEHQNSKTGVYYINLR